MNLPGEAAATKAVELWIEIEFEVIFRFDWWPFYSPRLTFLNRVPLHFLSHPARLVPSVYYSLSVLPSSTPAETSDHHPSALYTFANVLNVFHLFFVSVSAPFFPSQFSRINSRVSQKLLSLLQLCLFMSCRIF